MVSPLLRITTLISLLFLSACVNPDDACDDVSGDFTYGGAVTETSTSCVYNGSLDPGIAVPNPVPGFVNGGEAGVFTSIPTGLVFADAATGEIDLQSSTPGSYTVTNTLADCNVKATAQFELLPAETLTVQEIHFIDDNPETNQHYYILAEKETTHPELKDETKYTITWYWVKPTGVVRDITDTGNPGESAGSGAYNYFIESDPETGTIKTNETLVVDVVNLTTGCLTRLVFGKPLSEMPEPARSL